MLAIDNNAVYVRRGHPQIKEHAASLSLAGRLEEDVDVVLAVVGDSGWEVEANVIAGHNGIVAAVVDQFGEPTIKRSTVVRESYQADLGAR